jgi:hypothetical protein
MQRIDHHRTWAQVDGTSPNNTRKYIDVLYFLRSIIVSAVAARPNLKARQAKISGGETEPESFLHIGPEQELRGKTSCAAGAPPKMKMGSARLSAGAGCRHQYLNKDAIPVVGCWTIRNRSNFIWRRISAARSCGHQECGSLFGPGGQLAALGDQHS